MNRFTFTLMTYSHDPILSGLLEKAMDSGIKAMMGDAYYIHISFKDGSNLKGWNSSRYHAWLSRGCFVFPNESDSYNWARTRPSRSVMARLLKMVSCIAD